MTSGGDAAFVWSELGPEFRCETTARAWFAVRREDEAELAATGYGPDSDGDLRTSALSGRKPLYELATRRGTLVVRRFSHGGLLRFATGRRFADPTRPFREIRAAAHLEAAGVATPRIVAARARRAAICGYELDLVSHRIDDAVDLGFVLGAVRRGEIERAVVPSLCVFVGLCVRRLHAVGFLHADLTPNNLLVSRAWLARGHARRAARRANPRLAAEPEELDATPIVVLDLDRARIVRAPTDAERRRNLRRLYRFLERREARDGRALTVRDVARFFRAYDPSGTKWKDDWRAIQRDHARASWFHGFGWTIERWFGRRRDPREVVASRPR